MRNVHAAVKQITLTQDEYKAIRKYLDAIEPGIYLKCSNCQRWSTGAGTITLRVSEYLCEYCA